MLEKYLALLDDLRRNRMLIGWEPKKDREILGELEDIYEQLTEAEQEVADENGWRAWPEQYAD